MAASAAVSMPVSIMGMSNGQQQLPTDVPHQLPAQQHAQDDGGNGQPLDPAVGLDQLRGGSSSVRMPYLAGE
jgi:hypothetical protein